MTSATDGDPMLTFFLIRSPFVAVVVKPRIKTQKMVKPRHFAVAVVPFTRRQDITIQLVERFALVEADTIKKNPPELVQ